MRRYIHRITGLFFLFIYILEAKIIINPWKTFSITKTYTIAIDGSGNIYTKNIINNTISKITCKFTIFILIVISS